LDFGQEMLVSTPQSGIETRVEFYSVIKVKLFELTDIHPVFMDI